MSNIENLQGGDYTLVPLLSDSTSDVGITFQVLNIALPRLAQHGPIWSAAAQEGQDVGCAEERWKVMISWSVGQGKI
jgi:hypothetical protein